MESAPAESGNETSVLTSQDRNVVVNGELSTSSDGKEEIHDPDQAQKIYSTKKVTDLNGVTICTQSCPGTSASENHVTLGHSDQSNYDPSTTNMSTPEEKESSEQAGTSDTSEKSINLTYVGYESELQMEAIMALITKDLSEPYSIYTYRYFIHNWPKLCFLVSWREIEVMNNEINDENFTWKFITRLVKIVCGK